VEISEDSWFSERFGHPVFSVRCAGGGTDELARHAAERERATYQARVDVHAVVEVAALEGAGMRAVNVGVTLAGDPGVPIPGRRGEAVEVRAMEPERDRALLDLAERSFRYSRFHLDPRISQRVANRIKRDWVWSYLSGIRGEELLVAIRNGEPVGFLAVLASNEERRRVRVIDLIAVAPEAQGLGAGTALVRSFHERSAGRCDAVEVGTQLANAPAIAFYERLGYTTIRSAFDLHMHVG
jgi:ribosomal protein S18 acetylase RimI-like enzyme